VHCTGGSDARKGACGLLLKSACGLLLKSACGLLLKRRLVGLALSQAGASIIA
jgi:hypothetical protein